MGRKLKTIVVGLPLFAERLAKNLSDFDPANRYVQLDTYYKKSDKLKALFHVPTADCVFSINGTLTTSKVFDLALKKKVSVVMNWVGTDVLKSIKAFKSGDYRQDYIDKAHHFCEVAWIQEELKTIGIKATIANFASFDKKFELKSVENEPLHVLTYIPDHRASYYGIEGFFELAQLFPEMEFSIVGGNHEDFKPFPPNVKALGWVSDMDALYQKVHVCLRFPEHDGLSTFILEAMARGKQVLYKYALDHCIVCKTTEDLATALKTLDLAHKNGDSLVNEEAAAYIEQHFNRELILGNLVNRIQTLAEKA